MPRNGRLPGVGGGREAMADDAHGVDFIKIAKLRLRYTKKTHDNIGIDLHTGLYGTILGLRGENFPLILEICTHTFRKLEQS